MRIPWKLTDNSTGTPVTLEFDINPKTATYPGRRAHLVYEQGISPTSGPIIFQGRDEPQRFSLSGSVRTQQWYEDLQAWANKWYPLTLEDDLGNAWTVMVESIEFERKKSLSAPWRFDVSMELVVL